MKVGALVREIRDRFRAKGLETADLDARLLVADALGLDPSAVILNADDEVSAEAGGASSTQPTSVSVVRQAALVSSFLMV